MKEFLQIEGNNFLSGEVSISGAKNSAVAVIPISLLAKDIVTLTNIPKIDDVYSLIEILNYINVKTEFIDNQLIIDSRQIEYKDLTIEQISHLRASYYFISVFLGLFKKIKISQFGGCKIGDRPIDIHINGLKKLNINFKEIDQDYYFDCNEIKSAVFKLPFPSVGATINLMVAALSAKGIVKLSNCAQEPEIVDVAKFINAMGGKIIGAGTKTIIIDGGRHLHGCSHQIIPDRIEAGTYAIIAAANAEQVKIKNIRTDHLNNLLDIFIQIGINFHAYQDNLIIKKTKIFKPIDLEISAYPSFPTDLQQPLCVLLCLCEGRSTIIDNIYKNRTAHIKELQKMGAKIYQEEEKIVIEGINELKGCELYGQDLRGSAAIVSAALIARGRSIVYGLQYLDRGYEDIITKLSNLGANIVRKKIITYETNFEK